MTDEANFLRVNFLARFKVGENGFGVARKISGRRVRVIAGGLADPAFIKTKNGNALSREMVCQHEKGTMSNEALIAIVRPGAAEENGGGKRPFAGRKRERARERASLDIVPFSCWQTISRERA